jgi:inosine-uridine nucleoside N-ribohydrolase
MTARPVPVILDTDIGDDIDDTWALALLLRSPELDLRLALSDHGDTSYRARLLARLLQVAGQTDVPVGVGVPGPPEPRRQAAWIEDYPLERYPGTVHPDGVQALIDTILASPDPVTLVAIGPVPNIAEALRREPRIARRARFVGMHGSVRRGYGSKPEPAAEYNVKADPDAFRAVLEAPWPVTITPLDTCGIVRLEGPRYAAVRDCPDPLIAAVIENYRVWAASMGKPQMPADASSILFDTVAVYLAFAEDLLAIEEIPLTVTPDGFTRPDPDRGRPTRCATDWRDLPAFLDLLALRLAP